MNEVRIANNIVIYDGRNDPIKNSLVLIMPKCVCVCGKTIYRIMGIKTVVDYGQIILIQYEGYTSIFDKKHNIMTRCNRMFLGSIFYDDCIYEWYRFISGNVVMYKSHKDHIMIPDNLKYSQSVSNDPFIMLYRNKAYNNEHDNLQSANYGTDLLIKYKKRGLRHIEGFADICIRFL